MEFSEGNIITWVFLFLAFLLYLWGFLIYSKTNYLLVLPLCFYLVFFCTKSYFLKRRRLNEILKEKSRKDIRIDFW